MADMIKMSAIIVYVSYVLYFYDSKNSKLIFAIIRTIFIKCHS